MALMHMRRRRQGRRSDVVGPNLTAGFAGLLLLAAFVAAAGSLPRPLIVPTLSVTALGIAAAVAFIAWRRPMQRDAKYVTYWDVVGALTFLGMCAAALSEPDQLVPLLESARQDR
jgi:hypothetical protein